MSQVFSDLLAMDKIASQFGCGLNQRLRAAMEAELRFPARASAPLPKQDNMCGPLPANVVRLSARTPEDERRSA